MEQYISSRCGHCGKSVSRGSSKCPHCGVYFSGEKKSYINQGYSPIVDTETPTEWLDKRVKPFSYTIFFAVLIVLVWCFIFGLDSFNLITGIICAIPLSLLFYFFAYIEFGG